MPQVSVVIPLYNKSQYVGRALNSVFAQTYRDFEILVVDDGSTDDGPELVRACEDPRLRLVRQENQGPGAARNRGIRESTAPLVAFLDADDEWMPAYLERAVRALNDHPRCDAVSSACLYVTPTGDISHFQQLGVTEGPWNVDLCRGGRELTQIIYLFHTTTAMCRRAVVEKYGGFYEKDRCRYGEDHYLWLQVLLGHDIYRLVEPLGRYHQEASELGTGSRSSHALEPVFTDPEPIRRGCPELRRSLLERWFAQFALATAHELASHGDVARAAWLVDAFPLMRTLGWEFFKLRLKLASPSLIPHARAIKNLWGAVRGVR